MKKFSGKYCTVVLKPNKLNQQKFIRELIKKVNQMRLEKGLAALDDDDLDQGWQNMPVKDRVALKMRKWEKQKAGRKQ